MTAETTDLCDDCPPVGYPTDKTRCAPCPRRAKSAAPPAAQDRVEAIRQAITEEVGSRLCFWITEATDRASIGRRTCGKTIGKTCLCEDAARAALSIISPPPSEDAVERVARALANAPRLHGDYSEVPTNEIFSRARYRHLKDHYESAARAALAAAPSREAIIRECAEAIRPWEHDTGYQGVRAILALLGDRT